MTTAIQIIVAMGSAIGKLKARARSAQDAVLVNEIYDKHRELQRLHQKEVAESDARHSCEVSNLQAKIADLEKEVSNLKKKQAGPVSDRKPRIVIKADENFGAGGIKNP